ncbi:unnamed protein product [Urochloa decumbens]|uniref:Uncharacterized protein n=1 Tax=Urochloa decumbens TaxID=240449 RepID=A0ABC8YUY9_9POAL
MANLLFENPIVVAAIGAFNGRLGDPDAVGAVQGLIDLVRAEIRVNAAHFAETEAQLAVARRRYLEALLEAALALARAEDDVAAGDDNPELDARRAAYAELLDGACHALELHLVLRQALEFLLLLRAAAYARARAPLLPGVLAAAAAAYAIAYAATGGAVVPRPASLVRIAVLLMCFLFGFLG